MPASLSPPNRKLLLIAGAISLLLVGVTAVLASRGNLEEFPTTYSAGSGGGRAAYLLLRASGYPVERWERPMTDLPDGDATLILAEPQSAPAREDRAAVNRFVENGGRVIATGPAGAFFLPERQVVPDPVAGITWQRLTSLSPSFITRAAPAVTMAPAAYWSPDRFAVPLYGEMDKPRVVKFDAGRGEVIWWASATPLTNAGLREPDNLEFFLACLGDPHRRVLWDESFHGHGPSSSAAGLDALWGWLGVQLALATAAILLTWSRRSGPIVPPRADSRLSPLEFVRTLGSLYQRAGAAPVAVDIACQRFRYQLARRLGTTSHASADDLEQAAGVRWPRQSRAIGTLLRSCEAARDEAGLTADRALSLTQSLSELAATLELVPPAGKEHA